MRNGDKHKQNMANNINGAAHIVAASTANGSTRGGSGLRQTWHIIVSKQQHN